MIVSSPPGGPYYQASQALGTFDGLWHAEAPPCVTIRREDAAVLDHDVVENLDIAEIRIDGQFARGDAVELEALDQPDGDDGDLLVEREVQRLRQVFAEDLRARQFEELDKLVTHRCRDFGMESQIVPGDGVVAGTGDDVARRALAGQERSLTDRAHALHGVSGHLSHHALDPSPRSTPGNCC